MTNFEKSVVVIVSTVALCILIAILVLSSLTTMQVYKMQTVTNTNNYTPRFTRDRHGNLEIEIPSEFDSEPPAPKYRNPLGNTGSKVGDKE